MEDKDDKKTVFNINWEAAENLVRNSAIQASNIDSAIMNALSNGAYEKLDEVLSDFGAIHEIQQIEQPDGTKKVRFVNPNGATVEYGFPFGSLHYGVDWVVPEPPKKPELKDTASWVGCPFCGHKEYPIVSIPGGFQGYCKNCELTTGAHRTEEAALKFWNKRADVGTNCEL